MVNPGGVFPDKIAIAGIIVRWSFVCGKRWKDKDEETDDG
jgi:hypothetical protein